jgi:hypothetical protein
LHILRQVRLGREREKRGMGEEKRRRGDEESW